MEKVTGRVTWKAEDIEARAFLETLGMQVGTTDYDEVVEIFCTFFVLSTRDSVAQALNEPNNRFIFGHLKKA